MRLGGGEDPWLCVSGFHPICLCREAYFAYSGNCCNREFCLLPALVGPDSLPVLAKHRVRHEVFVTAPLDYVLSRSAFEEHAGLLHDAPRCRVPREVAGLDAIESQIVETKFEDSERRLRSITAIPERRADPVTELRLVDRAINLQADGACQNRIVSLHEVLAVGLTSGVRP